MFSNSPQNAPPHLHPFFSSSLSNFKKTQLKKKSALIDVFLTGNYINLQHPIHVYISPSHPHPHLPPHILNILAEQLLLLHPPPVSLRILQILSPSRLNLHFIFLKIPCITILSSRDTNLMFSVRLP